MKKSLTSILLCVAFVACACVVSARQSGPAKGSAGPAQGGAKPADAAKPATEGARGSGVSEIKEAGLKSLLEDSTTRERPLLINFWATWCTPCREEFPDLVKIRARYAADSLDFVLVSLDDISDISTSVPEFLGSMRATHIPSYLLNAEDPDAAINLIDPSWRGELPATFLFDRQGKLAYKHMGRIKPPQLQQAIEQTIK